MKNPENADLKKPKILLVDDRQENLTAFEVSLKSIACEIIKASSGEAALKYLETKEVAAEVAAIILDVQMPVLDGFEVAKRIRTNTALAETPILFVTALGHDEKYIDQAYAIGGTDYISKPVSTVALAAKIKFFVDLYNKTQQVREQSNLLTASIEHEKAMLLENSLDAVVGANSDETIVYWNKHAEMIFGWSQSEVHGKKMADLIVPERFRERHRMGMQRFLTTGEARIQNRRIEISALRKNGQEFPVELTVTSMKLSEGYRFYSFIRDITDQVLARKSIEESEARFRTLADIAPVMVWVSGTNKLFNWLNKRWLEFTGRSAEQETGNGWTEGVHPEDLDRCLKTYFDNFDQQKEFYMEYRLKHNSGEYRWISDRGVPRFNNRGVFEGYIGGCMDIHVQVLAHERIAQSAEQFKTLANSIPQLAWIAHADGNIQWYNDRWYEYTGTTFAEMKGWGWEKVHDPNKLSAMLPRWKHSLSTGQPWEDTFQLKRSDGEYRWFLSRAVPLKNPDGSVSGWFGTNTDIEETTEVQHQLIDTLESMSDSFFSVDKNWKITRVNAKQEKVSGIKRENQIGKNFLELFFPGPNDPDSIYLKNYFHAMQKRVPVHFDAFYEPLSLWTEVRVYPKSDGGLAVFFSDITEKKRSQARIQTVFETIPVFAGLLSSDGDVKLINRIAVNAIEQSQEQVLGLKFEDCAWWNSLPEVKTRIQSAIYEAARGTPQRFDTQYVSIEKGQAEIRWVDLSLVPISGLHGKAESITATGYDITKRVLQAKELATAMSQAEQARDEADRANQLKSAFLANMSHEIRTPLGAMLGFADLLREPGLTATERANYIDVLSRNGESLAVIINDILDLSKVEAGHLTLEFTDTYPDQIGADIVSLLRVKAKEKDLTLEYSFDETTPQSIVSDPTRVRQILMNLVGNALKFTQFGSVKIKSYGCKTEDGRPAICFEVADTGIGIPESQLEKVFEMFVQADGTMTRRFGGTGLGLALSRRLARALGGDVSITRSKEGAGTTFLVRIEDQPNRRDAASDLIYEENKKQIELKERALDGLRVLVVDDAPDNQQLIWRYLTKQGALVESAENGLIGYRAALAGNFDIVLMDIQMPIMDGYTATQKLRENGFKKPIIALTAHAMTEVRKKCFNVGCSDHLPKPINAKDLVTAIVKLTAH